MAAKIIAQLIIATGLQDVNQLEVQTVAQALLESEKDVLPYDVKINHITFRKGIKLEILINAATRWHTALLKDSEKVSEWISVEDRLPPQMGSGRYKKYIVCDARNHVFSCCRMDDGWHMRMDGCSERTDIIHWMPLPEPPKVIAHTQEGEG